MASVILSDQALTNLTRIQSKSTLRKIAKRINTLEAFPRIGIVDASLPDTTQNCESRIAYVSPYGIRYRYNPHEETVTIDAITDERIDSMVRFPS